MEAILLFAMGILFLYCLCRSPSNHEATLGNTNGHEGLPKNPTREQIITHFERRWEKRGINVRGGKITAGLGNGLYVLRDTDNTAHIICGKTARGLIANSYSQRKQTMHGGGEVISGVSPFDMMMMELATFNFYSSHKYVISDRGGIHARALPALPNVACEKPCCASASQEA